MRAEIEMGFASLADVEAAVSVFGSARTPEGDPEYELGVEVGRRLGEAGLAIITGGGPGAMEAANRGAQEAGVPSVGLTIDLPFEVGANRYLDRAVPFHYFFCRKVMFVRYACALVALPGGFGTLDELFEALTLIQTGKIRDFPVLLVGSSYWSGLLDWMGEQLVDGAKVDPTDLELVYLTDDLDEVVERVVHAAEEQGVERRRVGGVG
jgi:uncharacterized protein (TIGR00730 family)